LVATKILLWLPIFYFPRPVPKWVKRAKTPINPAIIPITNTYGQYVVNTIVAKSTVEVTTVPIMVARVLDAEGIMFLS
jgi:hypothetical protein